jgi:hypothetical protein
MPISTNAPFNEFGQSQILRDIEQLYLALNGAGSGGPGDGQTQDQSAVTSQDSGGVPDLSGLATIPYVDASIAGIPVAYFPYAYAYASMGSTGPSTEYPSFTMYNGAGVSGEYFTATHNGVYVVSAKSSCTVSLAAAPSAQQEYCTVVIDAPYGSTSGQGRVDFPNFTATGLTWYSSAYSMQANAIWCGYLAAGESVRISVYSRIAVTGTFVYLHVCGVSQ